MLQAPKVDIVARSPRPCVACAAPTSQTNGRQAWREVGLDVQRNRTRAAAVGLVAVPAIVMLRRLLPVRRQSRAFVRLLSRSYVQCKAAGSDLQQRSQKLVFFGGKGGVGKTSSSAAYAAGLAEQGMRTLILSTDPAHSLGDALATPLSGTAVEIADNLWAAEVDTKQALAELREALESLDAKAMLDSFGLPGGTTAALGLEELSDLLRSPPPGVDEIAGIARAAQEAEGYDVVVFDTAPTGHTLRMLEVPEFLGKLLDRALSIRQSIGGVLGLVGLGGFADKIDKALGAAEEKVRAIRGRVSWLANALRSPPGSASTTAEFVVVTRPTKLDVAEAERLVQDLKRQRISCSRIVINQIISEEVSGSYWSARVSGQGKVLEEMQQLCAAEKLPLFQVPNSSESLVGVPALSYLASTAFGNSGESLPSTEVVLFGGKGGVGKTSMSSASAVQAATEGKRVLIISTDPAHSLGDALDVELGESPRPVQLLTGSGELYAMEVDTAAALRQFQDTVRGALSRSKEQGGIVGQVLNQLPMDDFVDIFDTLPPGSDEIVALVNVLQEVKDESYDQIIIDTAPTGHALRLLSFPDFLERLCDRVARLGDRFGWLTGDTSKSKLRSFQLRMIELQDLFTDHERTSFAIVAIPTRLALEESKRLVKELDNEDIRIGMVIVNRILDEASAEQSLQRLMATQQQSLEALDAMAARERLSITRIPYLDTEVQGIYGLKYLSKDLVEQAV
mmetsp:Transcript_49657/g.118258  ORF Transcript_49657/g.118258 Transcript_49657/m.118258 type:complete len:736 (+) Transcript_49657:87-2294(+)